MSCSKDKPSKKPQPGYYRCAECGVVRKKKKNVCKPKKIKESK